MKLRKGRVVMESCRQALEKQFALKYVARITWPFSTSRLLNVRFFLIKHESRVYSGAITQNNCWPRGASTVVNPIPVAEVGIQYRVKPSLWKYQIPSVNHCSCQIDFLQKLVLFWGRKNQLDKPKYYIESKVFLQKHRNPWNKTMQSSGPKIIL